MTNVATIFQGASHVTVNDGTIIAANKINHYNYYNNVLIPALNTPVSPATPIKPNSSPLFTGREDILEKLKGHFERISSEDNTAGRRYFLIYGMGGIGKTQICLKFVEQTEGSFSRVFWVDASSEEIILLSLKGIAQMAGIDDSSENAVLHWIGSLTENWLLVFDNADHGPELMEKFIPTGQRGNILISSRNGSLRRLTTNQNSLELQEMEEADAILLLLKAACLDTPSSSDQHFAKAIVTELCCLPLAVDQAGSSIASGLCSITGYLKLYSSKRKDLLNDPNFKGASKYGQSVYGTLELSFQEIQKRACDGSKEASNAIIILKTFAFCHCNKIREEIFERAALNALNWNPEEEIHIKLPQIRKHLDCTFLEIDQNGQWDSLQFKQGIRLLLSFSFIKLDAYSMEYSVHPLIHAWSGERLTPSEQYVQSIQTASLLSVSSVTLEKQGISDEIFQHALLPHIIKHYEATGNFNMFENYYDDECENFVFVLDGAGYWRHSIKLWSKMFEMRSTILGKENEITLCSMQHLAITYNNLGRYMEAEKLFTELLEICKRFFGEDHLDTISSIQNLAITYNYLGRFVEAEKLQVKVLEMSKRFLGDEHLNTMSSMLNLAITYSHLGRFVDAEMLQVKCLEISKRLFGDEHPVTMATMGNLASTYNDLGRFMEAEKLQVKVLEISKRLLGDEHLVTISRMQNLATTYSNLERFAEAKELHIEVLELSRRFLRDEHPIMTGIIQLQIYFLALLSNPLAISKIIQFLIYFLVLPSVIVKLSVYFQNHFPLFLVSLFSRWLPFLIDFLHPIILIIWVMESEVLGDWALYFLTCQGLASILGFGLGIWALKVEIGFWLGFGIWGLDLGWGMGMGLGLLGFNLNWDWVFGVGLVLGFWLGIWRWRLEND